MKTIKAALIAWLLLALGASAALGETYTYTSAGHTCTDTVSDFSAGMEPDLMNALSDAGFMGDPVLGGVMCESYTVRDDWSWRSQWSVTALLHEGKTLLIYGTRDYRDRWFPWTLTPASDIFLPAGESVDLRALPFRDMGTGEITNVLPAVVRNRTLIYYLTKRSGELFCVRTEEGNGTETEILYRENGRAAAAVWKNGRETEAYDARFLWPSSLEFWRIQDVPADIAGLKAFESAHPVPSAAEYGVASGGAFRAEATGSSERLGEIVCAQVQVLGSRPGKQYPWYQVKLGDMTGWISFPYLDQTEEGRDVLEDWARVQGVGMLEADEPLRVSPGGEAKGTAPAGTIAHVLLRQNGFYYVSIPRGEIGWRQEAGDEFGWVSVQNVKTYPSPLQARLGMGERKLISEY